MGRAPCCDKNGLKKGPWTPEEDEKLVQFIQAHGPGNWRSLPKNAGLERCGKSCRLRWTNYLRPDIKRGRFSFEEEETIIQLHSMMGNKWSAIAARLPGRTDNEIKNYWNTHIRKRLLRMGIDPVTHRPRLDLLDLSSILTSSLCNNNNNNNNAPLLNLSSLMGLASHPLLNPDLLKLVTTLSALKHEHPNYLHENPLYNPQLQNQLVPTMHTFSGDQIQNQVQEVPSCTTSNNNAASNLDQTQFLQADYLQGLTSNSMQQNFNQESSNPTSHDQVGNSSFESMNNDYNINQGFCFDSVKSSPLSGVTPLNSSSTFVNNSTEDERESYCSSFLKFDIPEGFDISEFM